MPARGARYQAATTANELAAIPGWLLVGEPARLVDAAQRTAARRSIALRARLDDIHRGIAALDAELDALDGPETPNIRLFLEWSRWLESAADAATVLAELVPDPRRQFLAAEPAMSAETAQRMLDVIAANGGRVGDGQAFVDAAGLTDDDVFDLDHTARVRLDPLVDGHVLGVLLPMRLETRYRRPAPWTATHGGCASGPTPTRCAGGAPLPANQSRGRSRRRVLDVRRR